ncbi:MAG: AAA family ATPase, partial [Myxococcales bacterium]|nr:AAA family ATPase [Myxococcales bacterium]
MTMGLQQGSTACTCGHRHHDTRLVAITGGPGAGKTAVLELALHSFCNHVGVLPEAASIVFGGGFPRHDSEVALRAAQRAIYHVQHEQEDLVMGEREVAVVLCDRGTVDGLAY